MGKEEPKLTMEQHKNEMAAQKIYFEDVIKYLKGKIADTADQAAENYAVATENKRLADGFKMQLDQMSGEKQPNDHKG